MKKIIITLSLIIGWTLASAEINPKLMPLAEKYNAKCPVAMGDITMVNVENTDGAFIFYNNVSDDLFANTSNLKGILHDSMVAELVSSPDEMTKSLISECKISDTKIIERLTNSKGEYFDIVILPEEL